MIVFLLCASLPVASSFGLTASGPSATATPLRAGADGVARKHINSSALYSSASDDDDDATGSVSRRQAMRVMQQVVAGASLASLTAPSAEAAVSDETASFASPFTDSSYRQQSPAGSVSTQQTVAPPPSRPLTDEITYTITKSDLQSMKGGFGLELGEVSFRTNFRVIVKSVAPNSLAERLGIRPGFVVVAIDDQNGERTNAAGVVTYFSRAVKSVLNSSDDDGSVLTLVFRDPARFRSELENFPTATAEGGGGAATVSTKVAPAGDTTQYNPDGTLKRGASITSQSDQVVTITQLIPPPMCRRRATTDDLLEISYIGRVAETGTIFDGSAVKINNEAIPGRGNDISVFFVLGKQPFGQFPPGWDVGLEGMCVGERRRLIIPPVLAYGATGVPRRGIPPNATLQYDITLVSLNGLATPQ